MLNSLRDGFEKQIVGVTFEQAVAEVTGALKHEGFGVLSEIDVAATLKKKLDVDFRRYVILGACNPDLAHRALVAEPQIGLLLPCNVVVQETPGGVLVSIADPKAMFMMVDNPSLAPIAEEADLRLRRVIDALGGARDTGRVIDGIHEGTTMQTIIGQFTNISRAHAAIDALFERKYDRADISFLANDGFGEATLTTPSATSDPSGALRHLMGLGTVTIPDLGPVLASGPLAAGLASSSAAPWRTALGHFGVPAPAAVTYGEAIRRGDALVLVRGTEALGDNIAAILASCGAFSVERYLGDSEDA